MCGLLLGNASLQEFGRMAEPPIYLVTLEFSFFLQVRHKHFKDGDLKLKCTATISTVYWKSNEESVQESFINIFFNAYFYQGLYH